MKLLQNVFEILNGAQPLSKGNTAPLKDLHKQLERKQELISSLDARILEATTDDSEIEVEADVSQLHNIDCKGEDSTGPHTHYLCYNGYSPTED